jgi:O-antigen/teichoic acid export membrane protein
VRTNFNQFVFLSSIYAGTAIFLKICGFIFSLWLARSLDILEYGNYGLLLAIQTGVTTFGVVGIYEAVVGLMRESNGEAQRRKLFSDAKHVLKTTVGVTLLISILYVYFIEIIKIDATLILCTLISGAIMSYCLLESQLMRLEEKHIPSLVFSFAAPAISLLIGAIAFGMTNTLDGFLVGSCLGLALSSLIAVKVCSNRSCKYTVTENYSKKLFKSIKPYILIALLGWMSGFGNNLIISKIFSNIEVAQFTFVLSISAIMQLVASALNQVWSPHFFNIVHSEGIDKVEIKNSNFFLVQGALLGFIAMLAIILLPSFLHFIGGNLVGYAGLQIEFFIMFAGYIILIPWWHCSNYFLAHDRGVTIMNITLATSIVGISLWLALMMILGARGIYLGFFAQMLLRSVGIVFVARRLWALSTVWAAPSIGITLAAVGLLVSMALQ